MKPIDEWLEALTLPMPLDLVDPKDPSRVALKALLIDAIKLYKVESGGTVEALLYLRFGMMEPAHGNVQDAQRSIGAYIHGVLHRMEGDYWNAKYWFDRVRDSQLLDRIGLEIRELRQSQGLATEDWLGPLALNDACKNISAATRDQVVQSAAFEWQALWRIVNA